MHAGAVDAVERLGQEGGAQAVARRDGFDDVACGDDAVRAAQGLVAGEIYLVLAGGNLVVAGLDAGSHAGELGDELAADLGGEVGGKVQAAAAVVPPWRADQRV